jgi:hypothetical protein
MSNSSENCAIFSPQRKSLITNIKTPQLGMFIFLTFSFFLIASRMSPAKTLLPVKPRKSEAMAFSSPSAFF